MIKKFGILAFPAKHSLSPVMFNSAFKATGMDAQYGFFETPENQIPDFIEYVKHEPIYGLSVSLPYKELIIQYLNKVDDDVRKIGACNTVLNKGGILYGFNTDYIGSTTALKNVVGDIKNKKVVIIGAGGAARATAYGLLKEGANVHICNRSKTKADSIAIEFAELFRSEIHSYSLNDLPTGEILIHTTSLWTKDKGSKTSYNLPPKFCSPEYLENFEIVMDISYKPLNNPLILSAKKLKKHVITGDKMLFYQALEQFKIWTGKKAPALIMKEALNRSLV